MTNGRKQSAACVIEGIFPYYRTHYKKMTIQKMSKIRKWTFTAKEVQMTNAPLKRYSASFIIKEIKMQKKIQHFYLSACQILKKLVNAHG